MVTGRVLCSMFQGRDEQKLQSNSKDLFVAPTRALGLRV